MELTFKKPLSAFLSVFKDMNVARGVGTPSKKNLDRFVRGLDPPDGS
jgi:hypothetical protein